MRARALALAAAFAIVGASVSVLAACGGGASLPEPPPCAQPTPTPTQRANTSQAGQEQRYLRRMRTAAADLAAALAAFRDSWPDSKFYRSQEFRESFVAYSGAAACIVRDMQGLGAPAGASPATLERETSADAVLTDLLVALEEGRDAVSRRNTSGYRDWAKRMDAVAVGLTGALGTTGP